MDKYNSSEFIEKVTERIGKKGTPTCPFCGGQRFNAPTQFATLLIGEKLDGISIGPNIPAGILVCENCGHIELFALGTLGLLNKESGKSND